MALSFRSAPRPMQYPFGRPVVPRLASGSGPARVVLVGAHPGALHVRWTPPGPWRAIQAMAVDDEPGPFWDGADESERVEAWKAAVGFDPAWGEVAPALRHGGPGGAWIRDEILAALGASPDEVRATDLLDTFRCTPGLTARLADTYAPFAEQLGLPAPRLVAVPTEAQVVREALARHRGRLRKVLAEARPETVVTLGNAALRVLRELAERADPGPPVPIRLSPLPGEYGRGYLVTVGGHAFRLLPLAQPGAAATFQQAHRAWRLHRDTRRRAQPTERRSHPNGC